MTEIKTIESFVQEIAPSIVKGQPNFNAIFSTYNSVDDYPDGIVNPCPKGLRVRVVSGGSEPSLGNLFGLFSNDIGERQATRKAMRSEAESLINDAKKKFRERKKYHDPNLFVVYAGLRGFNSSADLVRELRQKYPQCFVAMFACDCDYSTKAGIFEKLLQQKVIDVAIFDRQCGGRGPMGRMVTGLIEAWERRS